MYSNWRRGDLCAHLGLCLREAGAAFLLRQSEPVNEGDFRGSGLPETALFFGTAWPGKGGTGFGETAPLGFGGDN